MFILLVLEILDYNKETLIINIIIYTVDNILLL